MRRLGVSGVALDVGLAAEGGRVCWRAERGRGALD